MVLNDKTRVVFDTDAGVDDAIALLMALHGFPKDALAAITTVFGNVDVHQADHNIAHILEAMERTDIPVYTGAAKPIVSSVIDFRWEGHGPDGFGGATGIATAVTRKNTAVHTLIDLAHKHKGELVVVAVGPLTNIALAILLDPEFVDNVKQFVVMGGLSRGEGNFTAHSEFNVGCDPEATDIVYKHCTAAKLHVVPFETTTDFKLPWNVFDELFDHATTPISAYVKRVWAFTKKFCADSGFMPCDAYAVALLLDPKYAVKARVLKGHIHLGRDEQRGASVWTGEEGGSDANVTLVTQIDKELFTEMLRRLAA